jgi:hypothetical protein
MYTCARDCVCCVCVRARVCVCVCVRVCMCEGGGGACAGIGYGCECVDMCAGVWLGQLNVSIPRLTLTFIGLRWDSLKTEVPRTGGEIHSDVIMACHI